MARHITYMVMPIEANPTTFYLKINYEYGIRIKRSETVNRIFSETLFKHELSRMYEQMMLPEKGAVKLTLNVSNFSTHHSKTLSLLDLETDAPAHVLSREIHCIRERFGLDIVKTADEL